MMCKPRLSTQLLRPLKKNTQTRSAFISGQTLPSNPSMRGHRHKYKPYWTEEIAELVTQRYQARKKVERDPSKDNRANYNKVAAQVKLLTKQCNADKWKRTCKDIDLRLRGPQSMETSAQFEWRNTETKTATT